MESAHDADDDAPQCCSEAASYSSVLICPVWVPRTYDGFKRVTNYDASLVFQDMSCQKYLFYFFSLVPVAPDALQGVRAVPGFGFLGQEGKKGGFDLFIK